MNVFRLLALGAVVVVTGCTSPAQQQTADQNKCGQYGFAPGSDAFAHCMMSSDMNRQYQNAAALRETNRRIDEHNADLSADFHAKMNADQTPGSSY